MVLSKAIVVAKKVQFIKNFNLPSCNNCVYYILGSTAKSGECTKFGEKDIISGKIIYENVYGCRLNENMCSPAAYYYRNL